MPRHPPARGRRRVELGELDELRSLLAHPTGRRRRRDGARLLPRLRAARAQQRLFDAPARARTRRRQAGRHPHPRRRRRHARAPRRHDGTVILHCFSSPALLEPALERGWYVSFAGNVTYKNAYDLRAAARRVPADRLLAETDSPYLAPQPVRGRRNEPAYVVHTSTCSPRRAATTPPSSRRRSTRTRPRSSACERRAAQEPRPALPRRREHPRRDRAARRARSPTTSCSRSGPGSACSRASSPSASRTCTQSSSTAASSRTSRAFRGQRCTGATRSSSTSAALEPPPTKLVANLPYNIATPIVAESLVRDQFEIWCVMVQREVADRFFAVPSTKAYGAVSVLVQLATERTGLHPVSREVFRPRPNVESALVAFRRIGPACRAGGRSASSRRPSRTAARRSRTRSRSPASRRATAAAAALARSGARRTSAPRRSQPHEFVALAEALRVIAPAPAKINLALVVGPRRADGKHEVATVYQRVDLGDRITVEPAAPDDVEGSRRTRSSAARSPRFAAPHGWRVPIEKHIPVAAGLGGGSSDAATALRLANAQLAEPLTPRRAARARRAARRGRAVLPRRRPAARHRRRQRRSSRSTCRRTSSCCCFLPRGAVKRVDRRRLRRASTRAPAKPGLRTSAWHALRAALRAVAPPARPRRAAAERPRVVAAPRASCSRPVPFAPTSAAPARPSTASSPPCRRRPSRPPR